MTAQTKTLSRLFVLALSAFLISAPVAVAQTATGEVGGTVTDPTGAVVPGANLTILNVATGVETSMQTNETGIYNFLNLLPGDYQLSVEVEGFQERADCSLHGNRGPNSRPGFYLGSRGCCGSGRSVGAG